jgi:hypothetical protein
VLKLGKLDLKTEHLLAKQKAGIIVEQLAVPKGEWASSKDNYLEN